MNLFLEGFQDKQEIKALADFWSILEEFDNKEREKLLFFVTSLKRPPLNVKFDNFLVIFIRDLGVYIQVLQL